MFRYRMPAEWEPHSSTWLTWPTNKITWPGALLKKVEDIYVQMICGLLPGENVNLLVHDRKSAASVLKKISSKKVPTSRLVFHEVKTVDTWIRDYGPIFVKKVVSSQYSGIRKNKFLTTNSRLLTTAFTKWIFNAWGGKYLDLARDNGVVDKIQPLKGYGRFDPGIILEGGSIDVNGRGTLLTTEQCLLNPNRNSKLSKKQIEGYLKKFLGIKKIIWLKEGIEADDTDGHVDDITRFVNASTVLTAMESDASDKNHSILEENFEILKKASDSNGKRFRIIELPMPGRVGVGRGDTDACLPPACRQGRDRQADRLPASYANFYIGNNAVLVPVYSHRNDKLALKILKKVFPDRKIIGIECTPLVYGLGSIHCVTQQEPL